MDKKFVTTEDLQKSNPGLFIQSTSRTGDGILRTDAKTVVTEKTAVEVVQEVKKAHESGLEKESAVPVKTPKS